MRIRLGAVRAGGTALQCRATGTSLLIHPKGDPDPQAAAFAAGLAPDPQHTVAVVDLPFGALEDSADAVARLLAHRGNSLRLVFGRATPQESRSAAQRIADRLDRLVLAPDGEVLLTDGGGLFIPSDHGAGWLRFRPGRAAERDSRRFPKPRWEFSTFDRPWVTSGHGVVEPVPSGVWVHSPHTAASPDSGQDLVDRLPSHPEILTVVLGSPGGPPVPLSDVARLWDTVLPSARSWVRFLHLGPVALPEGSGALGQELADALGQQVVLYTGVPVKARVGLDSPEVLALRPDGTPGHRPFVSELMYFPRTGGTPAPPALFGLRRPLAEVPEISAGVYEYAHDAVLEVVQCGLWMRPPAEPADGDSVRRIPAAPGAAAILYDRSTPGVEERMRALAEDMLWKLDPASREGFTVVPADEPGRAAGVTDEAYLWSPQEPEAFGPQVAAAPLTARKSRPSEIAPWAPESSARPQDAPERAAAPVTGRGQSPALERLDLDDSPAVRVGRSAAAAPVAPAPAPQAARTESDVPTAALPRTESDAGRPAGHGADADAARVATAAASGRPGVPGPGQGPEIAPALTAPAQGPDTPTDRAASAPGPDGPWAPPHPAQGPDGPWAAPAAAQGPGSPSAPPALDQGPGSPSDPSSSVQGPGALGQGPNSPSVSPAPAEGPSPSGPLAPGSGPSPSGPLTPGSGPGMSQGGPGTSPDPALRPDLPPVPQPAPTAPGRPKLPHLPPAAEPGFPGQPPQSGPRPGDIHEPPVPDSGRRPTPDTPSAPPAPGQDPEAPSATPAPAQRLDNPGAPPSPAQRPNAPAPTVPGRPKLPNLLLAAEPAALGQPPRHDPAPGGTGERTDADRPDERRIPDAPSAPPAPTPTPGSGPAPASPDAPPAPAAPAAPPVTDAPNPQAPQAPPPGVPGPAVPNPAEGSASRPAAAKAAGGAPAPARLIRLESDFAAAGPVRPDDAAPVPDGSGSPAASDAPGSDAAAPPAPKASAGVRVQPVPKGSACAVLPERGTAKERDWVRKTFSTQYNAVAGTVSRVMSESPGLRGGNRGEAADALTDLVAVRLYLSGESGQVDEAVRSAAVGPHVPLARCVAAGLRRLPSYRGAALLRARATPMEREWYREGRLATEWAFCTAYSAPHPGPDNGTDFLIWSMTARRTSLIEPAEPYRVMFLPGTTFKVLRPSDGEGPVLLRELSPSEIASDGKVDVQRVPLDEIALDGLERAAGALRENDSAQSEGGDQGGKRPEERFGTPPGLIGGARRQRPRGNGGDKSAPDKGAKL
ncbi:hypothetical protein ACIQ6V_27735 [Streptomyces sp. NPDC096198]|uniref:hypothetical protein n=1 Tax=Streptomyces sp. NPDC096198 TaxID=3366080 RepID=UPI00381B4AED